MISKFREIKLSRGSRIALVVFDLFFAGVVLTGPNKSLGMWLLVFFFWILIYLCMKLQIIQDVESQEKRVNRCKENGHEWMTKCRCCGIEKT